MAGHNHHAGEAVFEHLFESCEHLPEPSLLITRSLPMLFEYLRATHAVAPNGVQPFVQASWLQVRAPSPGRNWLADTSIAQEESGGSAD